MPSKHHYEVGESSNGHAISAEAKRRRQAYREMWRNVRNPSNEESGDPIPPQTPEESRPATAPALSSPEQLQDPDDNPRLNTEEGYLVTSVGEKVQFKWGRCIGTGPDLEEEEEEEEEEDPEEGDLEDPEKALMGEQQRDIEESKEDLEENFEGEVQGELEGEEEAEDVEKNTEEELEPMESSEDEEPWEIPRDEDEILDDDVDEGNEDEPVAIERAPEEWELSDSKYKGFPSDDDLY